MVPRLQNFLWRLISWHPVIYWNSYHLGGPLLLVVEGLNYFNCIIQVIVQILINLNRGLRGLINGHVQLPIVFNHHGRYPFILSNHNCPLPSAEIIDNLNVILVYISVSNEGLSQVISIQMTNADT